MFEDNSVCKIQVHQNQRIIKLCLEDSCYNRRKLCIMCCSEQHYNHEAVTLNSNLTSSEIMNLQINSEQNTHNEQLKQKLQSNFQSIIQKQSKIFEAIEKFKIRVCQQSLNRQIQSIKQSFFKGKATQQIKKIMKSQINSVQIEFIAKKIKTFKQFNIKNEPLFSQSLQLMFEKIFHNLQNLQNTILDAFYLFQQQIYTWTIFNRNFKENLQSRKKILANNSKIKQLEQKRIQQYQQFKRNENILIKHAQENGWKSINSWIESGKSIESLQQLDLSKLKIKKIQKLNPLNSLQKLLLNKNEIEIIQNLQFQTLQYLDLSQNNITQIERLNNLFCLNYLNLSKNSIKKIQGLQSLKLLKMLDLHGNEILKIENLSHLQNLVKLNLNGNKVVTMENINQLKNLKELYLGYNNIFRIQNIQNLALLTILNLHGNKIKKIENLDSLLMLKSISLGGNLIEQDNWNINKYKNLCQKKIKIEGLLIFQSNFSQKGFSYRS